MDYRHSCFLESGNNAHPKTGDYTEPECGFIKAWFHKAVLLTQLLHILVSGIYGGSSCTWGNKGHQAKNAALRGICTCITYIGEYDVHVASKERNNIGNDESAGGPDDQKRGQEAQPLREPEHLQKFVFLQRNLQQTSLPLNSSRYNTAIQEEI